MSTWKRVQYASNLNSASWHSSGVGVSSCAHSPSSCSHPGPGPQSVVASGPGSVHLLLCHPRSGPLSSSLYLVIIQRLLDLQTSRPRIREKKGKEAGKRTFLERSAYISLAELCVPWTLRARRKSEEVSIFSLPHWHSEQN